MRNLAYIPFPDWFVKADTKLFRLINHDMANPFFDQLMPVMRNAFIWAPLYLFIVIFVLVNYKKKGLWWLLFAVCTFAITDVLGARVFKETFERLRPCNDPALAPYIRMVLGRCSGGFSFVSNHAANHFGIAAFIYCTFRKQLPYTWLFFVWAGIISFAQVYVGVHFPFDVLGGTLLGIGVGAITSSIFNKRYGFVIFDKQSTVLH